MSRVDSARQNKPSIRTPFLQFTSRLDKFPNAFIPEHATREQNDWRVALWNRRADEPIEINPAARDHHGPLGHGRISERCAIVVILEDDCAVRMGGRDAVSNADASLKNARASIVDHEDRAQPRDSMHHRGNARDSRRQAAVDNGLHRDVMNEVGAEGSIKANERRKRGDLSWNRDAAPRHRDGMKGQPVGRDLVRNLVAGSGHMNVESCGLCPERDGKAMGEEERRIVDHDEDADGHRAHTTWRADCW